MVTQSQRHYEDPNKVTAAATEMTLQGKYFATTWSRKPDRWNSTTLHKRGFGRNDRMAKLGK